MYSFSEVPKLAVSMVFNYEYVKLLNWVLPRYYIIFIQRLQLC